MLAKFRAVLAVCWYAILLPFALLWEIGLDLFKRRARHTPSIPAKDSGYRTPEMGELQHYTDGSPSREWVDAARMSGHDIPETRSTALDEMARLNQEMGLYDMQVPKAFRKGWSK